MGPDWFAHPILDYKRASKVHPRSGDTSIFMPCIVGARLYRTQVIIPSTSLAMVSSGNIISLTFLMIYSSTCSMAGQRECTFPRPLQQAGGHAVGELPALAHPGRWPAPIHPGYGTILVAWLCDNGPQWLTNVLSCRLASCRPSARSFRRRRYSRATIIVS